ncbi:hypothetical protein V8E53_008701 [Lactarius tabidus]
MASRLVGRSSSFRFVFSVHFTDISDDDDELWGHLEEEHHACAPFRKRFGARKDLEQHNQQVHHVRTEFQRFFRNAHDVRQHSNSGMNPGHAPGGGDAVLPRRRLQVDVRPAVHCDCST